MIKTRRRGFLHLTGLLTLVLPMLGMGGCLEGLFNGV